MQRDHAYCQLQDLLLEEFRNKNLLATPAAVEDFVRLAAAKGIFVDDLIRMAESGMSGRQIAEAVVFADVQQDVEAFSLPPEGF
jgi:hypothetical protein